MSTDNICRRWPRECPVCGQGYILTNFMTRWAVDEQGRVLRTDTHVARCRGWAVLDPRTDERHPQHPWSRRRRRKLREGTA